MLKIRRRKEYFFFRKLFTNAATTVGISYRVATRKKSKQTVKRTFPKTIFTVDIFPILSLPRKFCRRNSIVRNWERTNNLTHAQTNCTYVVDVGLKVWSITANGTLVNLSIFERLGCQFGTTCDTFLTKFQHPTTGEDVSIIADPCHMLNLARNA